MDGESGRQTTYLAYMLRLWQAGSRNGLPVWRASLENPHTGERLVFGDAQALLVFLAECISCPLDNNGVVAPPGPNDCR